jgi:hypothetical protein
VRLPGLNNAGINPGLEMLARREYGHPVQGKCSENPTKKGKGKAI